MKALKTIVATAAIVFALTTVAVAGAQRFGNADQPAGPAAAAPAATPQAQVQAQTQATVTLTARQFARLLRAASHVETRRHAADRDRDRTRARDHATETDGGTRAQQTYQRQSETHQQSDGPHDVGHDGDHANGSHEGGGCGD